MVLRRLRRSEPQGDNGYTVGVTPETYESWRRTKLGSITEGRELAVVFRLAGPLSDRRLLDAGCGDGIYLVEAARRGATASGVDISDAMLDAATRRAAAAASLSTSNSATANLITDS